MYTGGTWPRTVSVSELICVSIPSRVVYQFFTSPEVGDTIPIPPELSVL